MSTQEKTKQFEFSGNQTNEAVLRVANRFRKIVEQSNDGILVFDKSYDIWYANEMAKIFLHPDGKGIEGCNLREFLDQESMQHIIDLCDSCTINRSKICSTFILQTKASNPRNLEICIVTDHESKDGLTQLYLSDRTELNSALDELRKQNAFLNNIVTSSVDGIVAATMGGKITLFNKAAQELLGYSESDALTNIHVTKLYPEGEAAKVMDKLRSEDFGGKGRCYKHRLYGLTKDGTRIPISLSGAIIYDEDGNEIATVGIFTDLRLIQKMERDLQRKQMELIQFERMASLGKLAAGVAHEINNPLTGILSFAEDLIEDSDPDDERLEDYKVIQRETLRCREIVRNLLDFARYDKTHMMPVDVNEIIRQTFTLVRKLASFQNCELTQNLMMDLPKVMGDAGQLQQVFLNLMVNAAEAMSNGGEIYVATRVREQRPKVEVMVSDTGDGIPPEILSKIFEPFFSTKGGKTNGLGLSVSYGIIAQHNGLIEVETASGQGTTFHIFLPVVD